MSRDHALERELLASAIRGARKLGVDARPFTRRVLRRLDLGDELYGGTFVDRDCFAEAIEEAEDLAAWALLEAERLERLEELGESVRIDLRLAVVAAALADRYLRRARTARDQREAAR